MVIVDCRFNLMEPTQGRQHYDISHIPGAYYLDLNQDLAAPVVEPLPAAGGRHPLPDPNQLAMKLAAMGVTAESRVVVYDDSRFAFGARLWWLLRYLGHPLVSVLDGGWQGWLAAGLGVEDRVPATRPGRFRPRIQSGWLVSRDQVIEQLESGLGERVLVDARSPERYRGEHEPIDPIAGSIPGAINRFWQGVTDEAGFARPASEQAERWQDLDPAAELWMYCGSGVTACVNLLSLELAGRPPGRLYGGGWSDWCAYLQALEATEARPGAAQESSAQSPLEQ